MSRPYRSRALAVLLALGAAACQDYRFNPVGHCLIQPGAQRFTLANISTADVLFVVDDSGSMSAEQQALADNFGSFIGNLTATNAARRAAGLEPIDFHIAVTNSSVFYNPEQLQQCQTTCGGVSGAPGVCCNGNTPAKEPRRCRAASDCGGLANTVHPGTAFGCYADCPTLQGELFCCEPPGAGRYVPKQDPVMCDRLGVGVSCGALQTHYDFEALPGCTSSVVRDEYPYPAGDFVSFATSATAVPNPRVLHFDKSIYTAGGATGTNAQGYTAAQLEGWFKQNIKVGTCGSGEEQPLEAGRLAIRKAFEGRQKDTRNAGGGISWSPIGAGATSLPAGAPARWPNPSSKLVVVFVGDEDDCSSPADPSGGVVMLAGEHEGGDACTRDASDPAPLGHKEYSVSEYVSFLTNLGRPVAAGFILPAAQTSCTLQSCTTAGLCCPPGGCTTADSGAQARGTRLLATAQGLRSAGVDVVAGSICDPDFGTILNDIAEIAKPPETLALPTQPAEGRITLLRIIAEDGTFRTCRAPLAPVGGGGTLASAKATGADWWFVGKNEPGPPALDPAFPTTTEALASTVPYPTTFVYINPAGSCIANPGETYSADYLGVVPPPAPNCPETDPTYPFCGGCARDPDNLEDPDGSKLCQAKLGGPAGSFECYVPPGLPKNRGTCTCKSSQ